MRKETKNGVTYTFETDDLTGEAIDVEVQPGIECLILQYGLNMPESEKSFPDVKCMTIKKGVQSIEIPNNLFPNVKRVVSEDIRTFESGRYLVSKIGGKTLKNVFCPAEDEIIEVPDVYYIGTNAFKGCKSIKISTWRYVSSCNENAFAGSAFMEQPFIFGVKMAGRILIDVDPTVEEVVFPDEEEQILAFAREVDLRNVKNLVLHNVDSLAGLLYDKGLPQKVTFIADSDLEDLKYEIRQLVSISRNSEYIKEIEVISPYVKCVDGIIYTSDMKTVIASTMYQTDVVIPEGVETVDREAFVSCLLTSIKLPDSLKSIGREAFSLCRNLRSVVFGTGITEIQHYTFKNCVSLENVILPSSLEKICDGAFENTNLSSIKLKCLAFSDTPMQEIVIPSTTSIRGNAFGKNMEHITALQYSELLITSCSSTYEPGYSEIAGYVIRLDCEGKTMYLPKYIKPSLYKEFLKTVSSFLQNFRQEHCEFWSYGYSAKGKEYTALAEYLAFGGETAKAYLKKNSKRIITRLLKEGDEENAAAFLKAGFVSKITLKALLPIAEENDMMAIKSYILSQINKNGITKQKFYI